MVRQQNSRVEGAIEGGTKSGNGQPEFEGWHEAHTWGALLLVALAVRLVFVWVAPNATGDSKLRFYSTLAWLKDPAHLPVATSAYCWPPMHFWLLGAVLWFWKSELLARVFTALLGALTIVPFWGIVRRAFDRRAAVASAIAFAFFGFHIAFSATTNSEAPSILFLACGVYGWLRFLLGGNWKWCIAAALPLGAASLIRFEPWNFCLLSSVLLLDFSRGWSSLWSNRQAWRRALLFGATSSAAAIAWMVFSAFKWGDPLELAHRTIRENFSVLPALRPSLLYRFAAIPGALVVSLSPILLALAALGMAWTFVRGSWVARKLGILAVSLLAWNWFGAVHYETTRARFTLIYSWLLLPFAFEALRCAGRRWPAWGSQKAHAAVLIFFLLWNGGIAAAAHYGPPEVADRLALMSPTLEPPVELRGLTHWLGRNVSESDGLVLDLFKLPSGKIVQDTAGLYSPKIFWPPDKVGLNRETLRDDLKAFIGANQPRFAVCSPYGPVGQLWSVDHRQEVDLPDFGIALHLEWEDSNLRVYRIDPLPEQR